MLKYYQVLALFACLFFAPVFLNAQDTIRVQTFEWDSPNRSDVFQFPDNPTNTYRKILMKYNMRCHDAAVGSGNVGCREWDYSCNTFITDSTRVDSTRQTAPSHIVSNFSGQEFPYVTDPTYSYTQYLQHQTALDLTDVVEAKIGTGLQEVVLPGTLPTAKAQFLYLADELTNAGLAAGPIHAFDLVPTQAGQVDFLRLRLKAVPDNQLDAAQPNLEGFTEVYFSNTAFLNNASLRFNFYQPFDWDGLSNILVEFSYTQTPNGSFPGVEATDAGFAGGLVIGAPDHALHFDGSGNVTVPTDHFSGINQEITIALWVNGTPEIMPTNSTIFEGTDGNNNRQANVHLPWGNGQVYWDCGNDGSGYDRINKVANEADFEGRWTHWAFTKNATTGNMRIYLNGELWHEGTGLNRPITISSFKIGSAVAGTPVYYGSLNEFQVWDKALDQATIQAWMRQSITPLHPDYDRLISYLPMNQTVGNTVMDFSPNGADATAQLANWRAIRGKDLFKNFIATPIRPDVTFLQGQAVLTDELVPIVEQTVNGPNTVVYYGVDGTDLVTIDTQQLYLAGYQYVLSETGEIVDSVWVAPDSTLQINDLTYFTKQPAKYEILSLVTPYGNGLNLGQKGKTFTFDVTDYAPILRGKKRMSIEMGGQNQEELDIEFLYITGTPAREVFDIQNVWPFRRGNYDQIQSDRFFEPRTISLMPFASHYKLRSAVTGHGQNGEFVPRTHYLNLDGGAQEFTYDVWKECADNPIYPQGGTWIFDRAGWCPGAATDVHEFDITNFIQPGGVVEVDYGVNGAFMDQANYLVSNQLVTYGAYNFVLDAALERVARPNNSDVEFERINPACNTPMIWVRNTGSTAINSLDIEYSVQGNSMVENFQWTGVLESDELVAIELPVLNVGFWETSFATAVFEAKIVQVNGVADGNADNNLAVSTFDAANVFLNDQDYVLSVTTNNNGSEYSYFVKNASGEIVMERDNMLSNTTYDDVMDLPAGCYTFQFFDAGHDGLQFWFFPENGSGTVSFKRYFNGNFLIPFQTFDPDFGSGVQFDFVIEDVVAAEEDQSFQAMSTYPNPVDNLLNVELRGFEGKDVFVELTNLHGQKVYAKNHGKIYDEKWITQIELSHLPAGMYFVKMKSDEKCWVNEVVKQ
ncbi:MAG: LamG-like jellyroll fold domain-containing protein [Saprospiraceae bacterium]